MVGQSDRDDVWRRREAEHQCPNGTRVENIAVRQNDTLVVTVVAPPEVWVIDPLCPNEANATSLISHANESLRITGIKEIEPDIFVIASDIIIWGIDFNNGGRMYQLVIVTSASLLNGITTLARSPRTNLAADSSLGLIWRANLTTGDYAVVPQDPTMAPSTELGLPLGVSGVANTRQLYLLR